MKPTEIQEIREKEGITLAVLSLVFAWFWAVPAIVLAAMALTKVKKGAHITLAVVGLVFSCISFIIDLIIYATLL